MATLDELYNWMEQADRAGETEDAKELWGAIQQKKRQEKIERLTAEEQEKQRARFQQELEDMPWYQKTAIGAGKTFTDIGRGAQGLYAKAFDDEELLAQLKGEEAEHQQLYSHIKEAAPVATFAGEMLPYLATAPIGGGGLTAQGLRLGGKEGLKMMAKGAGIEGLIGGTEAMLAAPLDQQGEAFGTGGILSAAIPFVGAGLRKLGTQAHDAYRMAKQADIDQVPLSPGQRLGSEELTRMEEMVSRIPGVGGAFRSIDEGQQKAVNRLALESMGETGEEITGDALEAARKNIGRRFEDAIGANQAFNYDTKFKKLLRDTKQNWTGTVGKGASATDAPIKVVNDILDRIRASRGMLSARKYQDLSSDLSDLLDSGLRGKEKRLIRQIKDGLDDMMERQLGGDKLAKFREARSQWSNYNMVKKALGDVDEAAGNISALKLKNRMKNVAPERLGKGQDPLARAARFGQRYKPLVPNPGSAAAMIPFAAGAGLTAMGGGDPYQMAAGGALATAAPWLYRGGGGALARAYQRGAGSAPVRQMAPQALTGSPGQLLRQGMVGGIVPGLLDDV